MLQAIIGSSPILFWDKKRRTLRVKHRKKNAPSGVVHVAKGAALGDTTRIPGAKVGMLAVLASDKSPILDAILTQLGYVQLHLPVPNATACKRAPQA